MAIARTAASSSPAAGSIACSMGVLYGTVTSARVTRLIGASERVEAALGDEPRHLRREPARARGVVGDHETAGLRDRRGETVLVEREEAARVPYLHVDTVLRETARRLEGGGHEDSYRADRRVSAGAAHLPLRKRGPLASGRHFAGRPEQVWS